jgi:nucleoside 2-deoxyribosyltransferase
MRRPPDRPTFAPPQRRFKGPAAFSASVTLGKRRRAWQGGAMQPRIYLAGPDVFLPDAALQAERKKAICAAHGLAGVSPLDPTTDDPAWLDLPVWQLIAYRNEAHIRACQAIIADLTPFRGPSADAGTVYEVGFGRALGLAIFAYSGDPLPYASRVLALLGARARPDGGDWRDADTMLVESFGCTDNLMIDAGVVGSGGALVVAARSDPRDLAPFERAVALAAAHLECAP